MRRRCRGRRRHIDVVAAMERVHRPNVVLTAVDARRQFVGAQSVAETCEKARVRLEIARLRQPARRFASTTSSAAPANSRPPKSSSSASPSIAGVAGSTSWPSEASNRAASSTAAVASGPTGSPNGEQVEKAIRRPLSFARNLLEIGALRWRDQECGGEFRTLGRVEHRRAIAHGARDDMIDGRTEHHLAVLRPPRRAAASRLEAEQSTDRSRDADRAPEVVGAGERHNSGRHGGGRSAGRTARRPVQDSRGCGRGPMRRTRSRAAGQDSGVFVRPKIKAPASSQRSVISAWTGGAKPVRLGPREP